MAYAIIPKPGTAFGPCLKACAHRDCEQTRKDAASLCHFCGQPIGYDSKYMFSGAADRSFAHLVCALADNGDRGPNP